MLAEADMGRWLEDDGLKHEPGGRVLQIAADLGGEVVHIPPLGLNDYAVAVECSFPA